MIVIDECHRSAWGEWHAILESNHDAIQIGLTATPRQIRAKEIEDEDTKKGVEEDRLRLADNYEYFGEPAYEYSYAQGVEDGYLAPADIEQYDIFHDDREEAERLRGVFRSDVRDKNLTNALTGERVAADVVAEKSEGGALEARLILPERIKAMSEHLFARLLSVAQASSLCSDAHRQDACATSGDPLQKTIIFCASDR